MQEKGNIKFNNPNKITKPLQFRFNYFEPFTKSTNLFTPNFYKQIRLNNKINNNKKLIFFIFWYTFPGVYNKKHQQQINNRKVLCV